MIMCHFCNFVGCMNFSRLHHKYWHTVCTDLIFKNVSLTQILLTQVIV